MSLSQLCAHTMLQAWPTVPMLVPLWFMWNPVAAEEHRKGAQPLHGIPFPLDLGDTKC